MPTFNEGLHKLSTLDSDNWPRAVRVEGRFVAKAQMSGTMGALGQICEPGNTHSALPGSITTVLAPGVLPLWWVPQASRGFAPHTARSCNPVIRSACLESTASPSEVMAPLEEEAFTRRPLQQLGKRTNSDIQSVTGGMSFDIGLTN